jgi:hypothetical protein
MILLSLSLSRFCLGMFIFLLANTFCLGSQTHVVVVLVLLFTSSFFSVDPPYVANDVAFRCIDQSSFFLPDCRAFEGPS